VTRSDLPEGVDLWALVGTAGLPTDLLEAFERQDWPRVRELAGTASRGVYGRQTDQLRARFPLGVDPILDQHRAWAAFASGNWDDLERCLAANPVDPIELRGLRDILLAPLDRNPKLDLSNEKLKFMFGAWQYAQEGSTGRYRRLARQMLGWRSDPLAQERGMSATRHARFRRLQDALILAEQEGIGGRLDVAQAIAREARQLGEEGDHLRVIATELEGGVSAARGGPVDWTLVYPARVSATRGPTPVEAANYLLNTNPLYALRQDGALEWSSRLSESIAIRVGAPRMLLRAESWLLAAELGSVADPSARTAALLIKARRASVGLRALPLLLDGIATRRVARFVEAEHTARRAGALWIQVSALTWMAALNPDAAFARWLDHLLVVSGWRRPALVPAEIAGEAALGLTSVGVRDAAVVELALAAGRPNVTYEVARRHLEEGVTEMGAAEAAIVALGKIGTTHARELLHRLARRGDAVGRRAAETIAHSHSIQLSEREVEVLDLAAHGLTNKQIGEKLKLSPHTVARHLANARAKLGAANRAEAAAKLGTIDRG